jgi:hypothetical protein
MMCHKIEQCDRNDNTEQNPDIGRDRFIDWSMVIFMNLMARFVFDALIVNPFAPL